MTSPGRECTQKGGSGAPRHVEVRQAEAGDLAQAGVGERGTVRQWPCHVNISRVGSLAQRVGKGMAGHPSLRKHNVAKLPLLFSRKGHGEARQLSRPLAMCGN